MSWYLISGAKYFAAISWNMVTHSCPSSSIVLGEKLEEILGAAPSHLSSLPPAFLALGVVRVADCEHAVSWRLVPHYSVNTLGGLQCFGFNMRSLENT